MKNFIPIIFLITLYSGCSLLGRKMNNKSQPFLKYIAHNVLKSDKGSFDLLLNRVVLPLEIDTFIWRNEGLYTVNAKDIDSISNKYFFFKRNAYNLYRSSDRIIKGEEIKGAIGIPTTYGTNEGVVTHLFYFFNGPDSQNCIDIDNPSRKYRRCSNITFILNENDHVVRVELQSFIP